MSVDLKGYSAVQKYYIQQGLPGFAQKKSEDVPQIKDSQYYRDTVNSWNNPARAGPKTLQYYHSQVEQGKPQISHRLDEERAIREYAEEARRSFLIHKKNVEMDSFHNRHSERIALQAQSKQDIILSDASAPQRITQIQTTEFASKVTPQANQVPLLGRAPHSWNKLNLSSKKYVDMVINPSIIKADEQALHLIVDRIQRDNEIEAIKQKTFEKFHATTRQTFLKQHARNMEFQAKCGLLPATKPVIIMQSSLVTGGKDKQINDRMLKSQQTSKRNSLPKFSSLSDFESQGGMKSTSTFQIDKDEPSKPVTDRTRSALQQNQEEIVIQYTNKAHQQSKQELDRINFGDELGSQSNAKVSQAIPLSLSASTIPRESRASFSSLKNQLSQQQNPPTQAIVSMKHLNDHPQSVHSDREYLTSAESHAKKSVNFIGEGQSSVERKEGDPIQFNSSVFELKNIGDVTNSIVNNSTKNSARSRIEKLSQPAPKSFQPKEVFDRTEFKGLLSMELGANAGSTVFDTQFTKTMKQHNSMINSHIAPSMRPQTRSTLNSSQFSQLNENTFSFARPSTTGSFNGSRSFKVGKSTPDHLPAFMSSRIVSSQSNRNQSQANSESAKTIELKNEILNELDTFDKKYQNIKGSRIGFSKVNLEQFQKKEIFVSTKSALSNNIV